MRTLRFLAFLLTRTVLAACGRASPPDAATETAGPADVPAVAATSAAAHSPTAEPALVPAATTPAEPAPAAATAAGPAPDRAATRDARAALEAAYAEYEIITLLPRDAIPAIHDPEFLSAAEADEWYNADEMILGVTFDGQARAYSVPMLSRHEIVNDTVAGVKIAVTW